jgi:hypothetical protein
LGGANGPLMRALKAPNGFDNLIAQKRLPMPLAEPT